MLKILKKNCRSKVQEGGKLLINIVGFNTKRRL